MPKLISHVRLVERLHTAELLHVLGLLADDGVDDVVDRDDAEHVAAFVDHRDGEQVVLGDEARDVLAIGRAADGERLARRSPTVDDASAGSASIRSRSETTCTSALRRRVDDSRSRRWFPWRARPR